MNPAGMELYRTDERFRGTSEFLMEAICMTLLLPESVTSGRRLCKLSLAHTINSFFNQIYPKSADDDLLEHCPVFVDMLILWTLSMTDDKLRDLEQRLSTCSCYTSFPTPTDGRPYVSIKSIHGKPLEDPLVRMCEQLFVVTLRFLVCPTEAPSTRVEKVSKGQRVVPEKFKKVIHYMTNNAPTVLSACHCWFKRTKHPKPLDIVMTGIRHWPKAFIPAIRSEEGQQLLSLSATGFTQLILELKPGASEATTAEITDLLKSYIGFMTEFVTCFPPRFPHQAGSLVFVGALKCLDFCNRRLAADDPWRLLVSQRGIIPAIHRLAHLTQDIPIFELWQGKIITLGGRRHCLLNLDQGLPNKIHHVVWMYLAHAVSLIECFNPKCSQISEQHRFPKCSRCRVVAYCSRECQAEAWTLPGCPHKDVCKDWKELTKCWPSVLFGNDWTELEKRRCMMTLSLPPGISENRMKELHDNVLTLFDMKAKRVATIVYEDSAEIMMMLNSWQ